MAIKIIAFGMLADLLPKEGLLMEAKNLNELSNQILEEYPAFKNYSYRIALNQQLVDMDTDLHDEDIVALLPPFSGG
jgi:molybdopterin synthase sulfur carrier subunit